MAVKDRKPRKIGSARQPLLPIADVRAYIREKAAVIAPGDVEALVARSEELLERAAGEDDPHPRLSRQAALALRLLADHSEGSAPQIPYFTVSVLAMALFYFLDQADAIPDSIPVVGTSDDALVMELAFEMGAAGIRRYCDWKDLSTEGLLPKPKSQALRRPVKRK